jgi:hypothetical protein
MCKASLAVGFVGLAAMLGVALASHFLYITGTNVENLYTMLYSMSASLLFMMCPIIYVIYAIEGIASAYRQQLDYIFIFGYMIFALAIIIIGLPNAELTQVILVMYLYGGLVIAGLGTRQKFVLKLY